MSEGLPSASLLENARLNALVIVPNAVQGIFSRRRKPVAAATLANVDGQAAGLLRGMASSYDGGPVWVRVVTERALLILDPEDVAKVLGGSPHPYASDPEPKRKGMVAFQPDALTISSGELWQNRRRFTDAVLGAAGPPGGLSERVALVCAEEVDALTGALAEGRGRLDWDQFHRCVQRIARRLICGEGAADDTELSEGLEDLMGEANGMPGEPADGLAEWMARLEAHLERAEPDSLAGLIPSAPADEETCPAGQVPHWLFALGDTLAINALRALALLAVHDGERERALADGAGAYTRACLSEAMRLWPTTPMLSRVALAETEWRGEWVPTGTQLLIVNTFAHRDPDRVPYADRFAPEEWVDGNAAENPAFNHFSRGPQGCPGQDLALAVGAELIAGIIGRGSLTLSSPSLDPRKPLPMMLDHFGIRLELDRL